MGVFSSMEKVQSCGNFPLMKNMPFQFKFKRNVLKVSIPKGTISISYEIPMHHQFRITASSYG